MRLEQNDRSARLSFIKSLGNEAHHFAFVVLVWPEHLEEFQSNPLGRHLLAIPCLFTKGTVE
jgi:hypothetical protein